MTKAVERRIAVIAAGPTRHSIFDVVPALRRRIGPIVGVTRRVASRAANTFRHGWAAAEDNELAAFPVIVAFGPGPCVDEIAERLARSLRGPGASHLLLFATTRADEALPLAAATNGFAFASALALRDAPPIVLLHTPRRWHRACRNFVVEAAARPFFCDDPPGRVFRELETAISKTAASVHGRTRKAGFAAPEAKALAAYLWSRNRP